MIETLLVCVGFIAIPILLMLVKLANYITQQLTRPRPNYRLIKQLEYELLDGPPPLAVLVGAVNGRPTSGSALADVAKDVWTTDNPFNRATALQHSYGTTPAGLTNEIRAQYERYLRETDTPFPSLIARQHLAEAEARKQWPEAFAEAAIIPQEPIQQENQSHGSS